MTLVDMLDKLNTIKTEISSLLTFANETTGNEDTSLGEAIHTLVDGFGQGGEGGSSMMYETGEYENPTETGAMIFEGPTFIPDIVHVILDDESYSNNPTKEWLLLNIPFISESYANNANIEGKTNIGFLWRGLVGTRTLSIAVNTINCVFLDKKNDNKIKIYVSRSATAYPINAGTYKWKAYKIW